VTARQGRDQSFEHSLSSPRLLFFLVDAVIQFERTEGVLHLAEGSGGCRHAVEVVEVSTETEKRKKGTGTIFIIAAFVLSIRKL